MRQFFYLLSLSFFLILGAQSLKGQETDSLHLFLQAYFENELLVLNDSTYTIKEDSITFSTLKFYISQLAFYNGAQVVWEETNSYHLINLEDKESLEMDLILPANLAFDQLSFQLGIDSLTNVSGAMGGDLDPTKGMYWAWNTGYINFKLEGNSALCPTRKKAFQFHLGGYLPPFENVQTVNIALDSQNSLVLKMDLAQFMKEIDLRTEHTYMSPSEGAKKLAQLAATIFYIND